MENGMEHMDAYFGKEMPAGETRLFEQRILEDPAFAEEVAFYLNARQIAKKEGEEEKKQRWRELYLSDMASGQKAAAPKDETTLQDEPFLQDIPSLQDRPSRPVRTLGRAVWYAAAVVFAALLFSWYLFQRPAGPGELANSYIAQHWQPLGVSMSSKEDPLQTGLLLYNEGKWQEALGQFESILRSGSQESKVKEYAGIAALRCKDYDKALTYFRQLSDYRLRANPGLFYQAITLMERNQSGDPEQAKQLLLQVVNKDLEGKETALEWLRKL